MTAEEFNKLVRKGAVTHVGAFSDVKRTDFADRHVTQQGIMVELQEAKIDTIPEIFAAIAAGGFFNVEGDIKLEPAQTLTLDKDTEIVLNSKTISGSVSPSWKDNGDMIHVAAGKSSISGGSIIDELAWDGKSSPAGTVYVTSGAELILEDVNVTGVYPVWVKGDGALVTIKSGNFKSTVSQVIYVQGQSKVVIEGGTFEAPNFGDKNYCLNIKDSEYLKSKSAAEYIEVRGGRFIGFNPGAAESENLANFVAEGYESVKVEDNIFEVRKIKVTKKSKKATVETSQESSDAPVVDPVTE